MTHVYTYSCMDIILSIKKLSNRFSVNVIVLFDDDNHLFANVTSKTLSFLQVENFLKLVSLEFPSFCLPQFNIFQKFIRFSIRKRQGQKQKLSLISFHLFGMMIKF